MKRIHFRKKYLILSLLTIYSFSFLQAQDEEDLSHQFFISPDFALMLGTVNRIEVAPALGYHITDRLSVAAGFKYEFYSQTRLYPYQEQIRTSIYGPKAFARYTIFKDLGSFLPISPGTGLFAHAEIESSNLESYYFSYNPLPETSRFWYTTFLVGGGISQSASDRMKLNFVVLWDTGSGLVSLYSNPIFRFGMQIYLRKKQEEYPW